MGENQSGLTPAATILRWRRRSTALPLKYPGLILLCAREKPGLTGKKFLQTGGEGRKSRNGLRWLWAGNQMGNPDNTNHAECAEDFGDG
jgi:hypothetical protein